MRHSCLPASVTLTRTTPDAYRWPSGRLAISRWDDHWIAILDNAGHPRPLLDKPGFMRLFPSPTLAASALGARLPAE